MDYRNLSNGSFEYLMKNALIERYRDEVKDLSKETDEEFSFADVLKKELRKNENDSGGNNKF